MAISVYNFYSNIKSADNPFLQVLENPTFYILVKLNGKMRELALKMSGDVKCPPIKVAGDFEIESCRNYLVITDYLMGEYGDRVRESWGLSKEDFRELVFELYFCLVKEHSKCGIFKKALLILFGMWKFFVGKVIKC